MMTLMWAGGLARSQANVVFFSECRRLDGVSKGCCFRTWRSLFVESKPGFPDCLAV